MARVHNVRIIEKSTLRVRNAYLAAAFAHVRLLAGMNACVYSQRRSLDKLLIATGIIADMRSNATVYTFYTPISDKSTTGRHGAHHAVRDHFFAQILYRKCCTRMLFDR